MKKPLHYFSEYVRGVGGRKEAAKRLGFKSVGQISHILCGRRGITPQVAIKIEQDTDGAIQKAWLRPDLWGETTQ